MGPLKISLIILGFFAVAAFALLAGSFVTDHIFEHSARQHPGEQAGAAAVIVPIYFLAKFVICPIIAIAAGVFTSWKIAKSNLAL